MTSLRTSQSAQVASGRLQRSKSMRDIRNQLQDVSMYPVRVQWEGGHGASCSYTALEEGDLTSDSCYLLHQADPSDDTKRIQKVKGK